MSFPIRVVRVFPMMTPSGLHMGTILKTRRFLSSLATRLLLIRKLTSPCTIQLEDVSPGCSRAYTKTTFLALSFPSKFVMVSRGTSTPPRDLQSTLSCK